MSGAPYQVDVSATDDETQEFSLEWLMDDGTDFPWASYAYRYRVHRDGCSIWDCWWGGPGDEVLTAGAGLAVDPVQNLITVTLPATLAPGRYRHGCSIADSVTGKVIQVFDGSYLISEGNL